MADGVKPIEKMNVTLDTTVSVEKLMEMLYEQAGITDKDTFNIFVGRIIRDPEDLKATLSQLVPFSGGQVNVNASGSESGERPIGVPAISFNQVVTPGKQTTLKLLHNGNVFKTITGGDEHILGRKDTTKNINPSIDVSSIVPVLPNGKSTVSRQQAIFQQFEGRWMVRKHRQSGVSMYVNNRSVTEGQDIVLNDGDTLSVGKSLDDVALKLVIRITD